MKLSLAAVVAIAAICLLAPLGLGCSSGQSQPSAAAASDTPPVDWEAMSGKQKFGHMKHVIMPAMGDAFKRFDSQNYSDFKCSTCHGPNARDRSFEMPNPDLEALPTDFSILMANAEPKVLAFMKDTVVPETAKMLGMETWSPDNPTGFGCFNCHTKAE